MATQPMIPLAVPDLTGNEANYLQECIDSTFVSSVGPFVDRFEEALLEASGATHAVATSTGTAGLHLALTALGVGRDDLVILPSLTFIASANAISYCGATPWLMDVSSDSWNLDVNLLETSLRQATHRSGAEVIHTSSGRRVAAILPVYALGLPADMNRIMEIAHDWNLPVVADAAAALGSIYHGKKVGNVGADLTVFSFNGNKTVTTGGGGGVIGEREKLMKLIRHLSTTAREGDGYDHDRIGFNYRMTNVQAALGCAQLERLPQLLGAKREISRRYEEGFLSHSRLVNFPAPEGIQSACWFSGVYVPGLDYSSMGLLKNGLLEDGIAVRYFWKPVHLQTPYQTAPTTRQTVSESLWYQILTLPCSTNLSKEDQEHVISSVIKRMAEFE